MNKSFLPGDHLEASELVNEELSASTSVDYEKVRDLGKIGLRKSSFI